jgi:ankyrin repeat protein
MTPLQHAAYKGNKEIVQMLLDRVSVTFWRPKRLEYSVQFNLFQFPSILYTRYGKRHVYSTNTYRVHI